MKVRTLLWLAGNAVQHPRTVVMGFREGLGDCGMTWEHDDNLNEAYDTGRALRRTLAGME